MFPTILDMKNAKGAVKQFFQKSPKEREAHFNTSLTVKCCRDNKLCYFEIN